MIPFIIPFITLLLFLSVCWSIWRQKLRKEKVYVRVVTTTCDTSGATLDIGFGRSVLDTPEYGEGMKAENARLRDMVDSFIPDKPVKNRPGKKPT